jgi:hypothetical protein
VLTHYLSEATLFSLQPIFMHQSDRQSEATFKEEFYIVSKKRFMKETLYLHRSMKTLDSQNFLAIDPKQKDTSDSDKKVGNSSSEVPLNLSISEKHNFCFQEFDHLLKSQENSLSYGNLIWLLNIENEAKLLAEPEDDSENNYKISFLMSNQTLGKKNEKHEGLYEGLWEVENFEMTSGVCQ